MYSALLEHPHKVTVKIMGIAASAASVVAMAGDEVLISPVGYLMIHDPWSYVVGNAREMEHEAQVLREIGEGIVAAYQKKTGKTTDEIKKLLEAETYMNAQSAIENGFCDGLFTPDEDKAALAQASAKLKTARNSLGYTTVRSPLDGVAGMIPYHVGALVSSNIAQPLVTVSDDEEMLVYFSLSERECTDMIQQYGSIDAFLGQMPQVKLRLTNGTEYTETGRVDAVSGIAEQGTVSLRARFPNPARLLRNGSSATIVLQTPRDSVIVIPQTATYELQNRIFAYRVVDGKAQTAPLEVFRLNNGTEYVVESGLRPGDVIIARGAGLIREGQQVE
jgi:RND family efflux transporter MFP subunit